MSRLNRIQRRLGAVAELIGSDTDDPDPEAYTRASTDVQTLDTDVSWPEDEVENYWRLYETNPLISGPIDRLASEVIEPGYWVEADTQRTETELTEFLEHVGIEGGKPKRNFARLVEQAVIQHEVRGTFMAEKVMHDGRHIALNPVQSNTFKIHTKPDSNILVAPDDHTNDLNVKKDEEGKAAAFVQFDNQDVRYHNRRERRFQRDQIIHWPRRPDIGDVRGTSRLEAVYNRARALQAKLRDNDDAIAMKAWPMILFQLGEPEAPWTDTQQEDFMEKYEEGNLGPGMYHGVPGDVDIQEFAGETADIGEAVSTDVDMVISGMPGPRYALGGFEQNVSTTVAGAQERFYKKLVRSLRRDIEDLVTPYLKEVAESWNEDPSGAQLHIGKPNEGVAPEQVSGSIIRYTSDVSDDGDGSDEQQPLQEPTGGSSGKAEPVSTDTDATDSEQAQSQVHPTSESIPNSVATDTDVSTLTADELADPRLVATNDEVSSLTETIQSVLVQTRDETLDQFDSLFQGGSRPRRRVIDSTMRSQYSETSRAVSLDQAVEAELKQVAESTTDTVNQSTHSPSIDAVVGPTERQLWAGQTSQFLEDIEDVLEDMIAQTEAIVGTATQDSIDRLRERVRGALDDATLRERARLIAHMHTQQLVNTIKLSAYQNHPNIIGIEITNPCTGSTESLCTDLAGCSGEPAQAVFESKQPLGAQLQSQTDVSLADGFDPLPAIPPFHQACNSGIVPITEDSLEN